jgi:hypothetical protein
MGSFLLASIVGSIVLTVLLNLVPRLLPGPSRRAEQRLHDYSVDAEEARRTDTPPRRVQVYFPWRGMLIASIVLTIVVNLAGLLFS